MSKHTPGPWRLEEVIDGSIKHLCPVGDVDGFSLLTVVNTEGYDDDEYVPFAAVYRDADARLIAAAPDLLEALKDMLNAFAPYPWSGWSASELAAIDKARAAIKAAEES